MFAAPVANQPDLLKTAIKAIFGITTDAVYDAHPITVALTTAGVTNKDMLILLTTPDVQAMGLTNPQVTLIWRLRIWFMQPNIALGDCAQLTMPELVTATEPVANGLAPSIVQYQANLAAITGNACHVA